MKLRQPAFLLTCPTAWVLSILFGLLLCSAVFAAELRDYYITVDPGDLEEILANPYEDIYIDCVFAYEGFIWEDARIRLRGESSREYPKKSYKINFDADNRFGARDKINLISCWTDPSFIREHLSYDAYARAGLPASRTWFARFFVNGVYFGLFLDVEQVDEHFLDYTDLPDDGTLFKASEAGALLTAYEDIEALWEQETNASLGFDSLIALREWIDECPSKRFERLLERKFDPEELARVIALNALIGNQSTYYHNYYLLQDSYGDGKWTYLPWDMDRTFYYWTYYRQPHYYRSGHQGDYRTNPLISKCWLSPGMRALIEAQIVELSETLIDGNYYDTYISELRDLLYDAVASDTAKQYTTEDFENELASLPAAIQMRSDVVRQQIEAGPTPFLLKRTLRNAEGSLLHWTESYSPVDEPISYDLWISDNMWFTGENVRIIELDKPYYLLSEPAETDVYFRVYAQSASGDSIHSISYYEYVANGLDEAEGVFELEPVTDDRTFTSANGPVLLPAGLRVEASGSLRIEPGTVVKLGPEQSLQVYGSLSIAGTVVDSVFVEPYEPNHAWSAIYIKNAAPASLSFASIRGGGVFHGNELIGSLVFIYNGELNVTDCLFRDAYTGAGGVAAVNCAITLDRIDMELALESFGGEQNMPDAVLTFDGSQTILNSRIAKVPGALYGGDLIDCERAGYSLIRNCVLENPGDDAIDYDYAEQADISGNRIHGCQDNAFSLGFVSGFQIYNNIITDCANGVYTKDGTAAQLYNNVIAFCGSALRLNNDIPPSEVIVRNCAFLDNTVDIDPDEAHAIDAQYCAFSGAESYPGAGNISGDLLFLDAANRDFRLQAVSPLIDAGWGTGCPLQDIRNEDRVDIEAMENTGGGEIPYVDIGAYEYVVGDPEPPPPVPAVHLFIDNYPNPFNGSTMLRFSVTGSGPVEVVIYDALGRRVFGKVWYDLASGTHTAFWDARTNSGGDLASGSYFVRLKQAAGSATSKLVVLR